jgi:hypothetical protein
MGSFFLSWSSELTWAFAGVLSDLSRALSHRNVIFLSMGRRRHW